MTRRFFTDVTQWNDIPPIYERLKCKLLEWRQLDGAGVWRLLLEYDAVPKDIFGHRLVLTGPRWLTDRQRRLLRAMHAQKRRAEAARLAEAKPVCCDKELQCGLGDCGRCGRWFHLRQACAGVAQSEHRGLRRRWYCQACKGGDGDDGGESGVSGDSSSSDGGASTQYNPNAHGWWVEVPQRLLRRDPADAGEGTPTTLRLHRLFQAYLQKYVGQCDLEARFSSGTPASRSKRLRSWLSPLRVQRKVR